MHGELGVPEQRGEEGATLGLAALAWTEARKARADIMGGGLFANPAWDILLDAYVSQIKGHRLCASDICAGSGVPPTTVLRWLAILDSVGLIERARDPADRRRIIVTLTLQGQRKMEQVLAASKRIAVDLG